MLTISLMCSDRFVRWCELSSFFFVKSVFFRLDYLARVGSYPHIDLSYAFKSVWKSNIPSNNQVFTWRLLLNRLQTRDQIAKRIVIIRAHNLVCPLCLGPEELHSHLFLFFTVVEPIWFQILD